MASVGGHLQEGLFKDTVCFLIWSQVLEKLKDYWEAVVWRAEEEVIQWGPAAEEDLAAWDGKRPRAPRLRRVECGPGLSWLKSLLRRALWKTEMEI